MAAGLSGASAASPSPHPRSALVFIGFMGAGKSTAARAAAARRGVDPVDADRVLEAELGTNIHRFFDEHGEAAFRAREEEVVGSLLERADGGVIALGGGSIGSARVREALERHVVALLDVDVRTAWKRASGRDRPLARDRKRFATLHAERAPLYEQAADAIVPAAERDAVQRALPAVEALEGAPRGTRMLWACSASAEHPVYFGRGLLGSGFRAPGPAGRAFAVTDENVARVHPGAAGPAEETVTIPAGEEHKTLATAETVLRALARAGMTRADHLVAVGGGVVGDVAGFCAATYQRGVDVVHVPTTLVAQVDSAYGGKTGVDLPEAKNYVGAYHHPAAVLTDPGALETLPAAELAAGYAEVVKTALIAGGALWERVEGGATGEEDDVILACVRAKLAVVAGDERDRGRRQVLNLGHTVGHAIEAATGYRRYRHGEAVALGLLAALRLSDRADLRDEVAALFEARGLPVRMEAQPDAVVAATARDKKRADGGPAPFVLVEAPGSVYAGCRVDEDRLRSAVEELVT